MENNIRFVYNKEYWYVSAFLDTNYLDGDDKSKEIETLLKEKLANLTMDDLSKIKGPNAEDYKRKVIEMGRNISLKCTWIPYFEAFPYRDENTDMEYNTLGYFQFEVEYYKDDQAKKETILPILIQQIPSRVLLILREFNQLKENEALFIDRESPIYVFVTSSRTLPAQVSWTEENIEKFKRVLGNWTEVYSGQWPDYSESLYDRRIQNNLSNRLSELHFIRRNSGFIYMAEENYRLFFNSYMIEYVLEPTPKIRTMLFALMAINESLDFLFTKRYSDVFMNLEMIEQKIKNLRYLRGMIQTKLSLIYNELDYNRRQHYTTVLKHLISEFNLDNVIQRVNDKFEIISDSMQELYVKKSEENQERTERGLNILNILFGAGIFADFVGVLLATFALETGILFQVFNGIVAVIIGGILVTTFGYFLKLKREARSAEIGKAVDAVVLDGKGNVVLIKRRYPPYRGQLALPGGFVKYKEDLKKAVIREVAEETNLHVKIINKIGVYDARGRDPRGNIITTAFKCQVIGDPTDLKSTSEVLSAEWIPIESLKEKDLAFDHEKILKEAGIY
ncbi:MAG: NUDIX domain-containing protein [Candidatus Helarchaeota archaeon]